MTSYYGSNVPANYRQASVLIIDDNPDHWTVMQSVIQHVMPRVNTVWVPGANGTLAYLDECQDSRQPLPKLILLDLYLPGREHGQQLLRALKKHPAYHRIPVVVLSYSDDSQDIKDMYQEGGNSYIVKPVEYEKWVGCFQTIKTYWWDSVTLPGNSAN